MYYIMRSEIDRIWLSTIPHPFVPHHCNSPHFLLILFTTEITSGPLCIAQHLFQCPKLSFMSLITPTIYSASSSHSTPVWLRKRKRKGNRLLLPLGCSYRHVDWLPYFVLFCFVLFCFVFLFLYKSVNAVPHYYRLFSFLYSGCITKSVSNTSRKLILPFYSAVVRPQMKFCVQIWLPSTRKALTDWRESSGRSLGWSVAVTNLQKETETVSFIQPGEAKTKRGHNCSLPLRKVGL